LFIFLLVFIFILYALIFHSEMHFYVAIEFVNINGLILILLNLIYEFIIMMFMIFCFIFYLSYPVQYSCR